MKKMIVYESRDEVLVMRPADEIETIRYLFSAETVNGGTGDRDMNDYDRFENTGVLIVNNQIYTDTTGRQSYFPNMPKELNIVE